MLKHRGNEAADFLRDIGPSRMRAIRKRLTSSGFEGGSEEGHRCYMCVEHGLEQGIEPECQRQGVFKSEDVRHSLLL
jgi:hypothetical protein